MFIDTDIFYAYFTPSDWLHEDIKHTVEIIKKKRLKTETSVLVIIELEILIKREDEKKAVEILKLIKKEFGIKIIPLNKKIMEKAFEYQQNFGIGIFDSFHAATCFFLDKKILSTDKVYDKIEEIKRVDPRKFHL